MESEDLEDGFDEEPLNDQQWILQRKKIGLSRRTKRSLRRVNQTESKNRNVSSFLKSFKRKGEVTENTVLGSSDIMDNFVKDLCQLNKDSYLFSCCPEEKAAF